MRFVDTNVLLYAVSTAQEERSKAEAALAILDDPELILSTQVLQEFYVQSTRASRPDALRHEHAAALIDSWLRYRVIETSTELVLLVLATRARWGISYWDAAIVEAARLGGCSTVLSEDLQSGMDFAGVRVEDPFAGS